MAVFYLALSILIGLLIGLGIVDEKRLRENIIVPFSKKYNNKKKPTILYLDN